MKQIFKKLTAAVLVVMMLASSLLAAGLVQALAAAPTAAPAETPGSAVVPQAASATVTYWVYPGYGEQTYAGPETHQVGDTITILNKHPDKELADSPEWYGNYMVRWYCKQDKKFYALNAPYTITTESVDFYVATFLDGWDDLYQVAADFYWYEGDPMEISEHTLKFAGDGVSEEPVTEYEGYVVELPDAPEGKSWKSSVNGKYYESGDQYVLLDDDTLTAEEEAEPEPVTYTVKFENADVDEAEKTVEEGTEIILPTPTKDGNEFKGWLCDVDQKTYDGGASYTVNADVTFTAQWEEVKEEPAASATVTYWLYLGYPEQTYVAPETHQVGDTITVLNNHRDKEYVDHPEWYGGGYLIRWYCKQDKKFYALNAPYTITTESVDFYEATFKDGVDDLYAGAVSIYGYDGDPMTISTHTLKFAGDGVSEEPVTEYEGYVVELPDAPEGKSWKSSVNGKYYESGDQYVLLDDDTLTAEEEAEAVTYTVKFDGDGVTEPEQTIKEGQTINLPAAPTRSGYNFKGWKCSVDEKVYEAGAAYTVNADVTFTAQWEIKSYVFVSFTGAKAVNAPMTGFSGDPYTIPSTNDTKEGYEFGGWTCDYDGKTYQPGEKFILPAVTRVVFTAVWNEAVVKYTVTFAGEGVSVEPMTVDPGTEIELPVVTRAGFTAMGWHCDVDGKTYAASTAFTKTKYTVNEDVTFTMKWGYSVMFQGGGSVAGGMMRTLDPGATLTIPEVATTPAGKTFTGWKCSVDSKIYQPGDEYTVNSAVTFTAQFDTATYTVKYTGDGVTGSEETIAYNTKITLAAAPTRSGYTFKGWLCDVDETVYDAGAEYTVKSNVTFTAQWEAIAFVTVRFMGATVSGGGTKMGMAGGTITVPKTTETRAGYEFGGWICALDGKTYQPDEKYTLVSDTTFEAVWNKVTVEYTVKYTGDGVEDSEVKVEEGTEIDLPAAPEKTGYNFKGWLCSADETVYAAGAKYTVNSDVTFTAQWEIQTFTVTFVDETGKTVSTLTKNYGETLAEADYPAVPEKEGYTGKWETYSDPITKDITVKLTYTKDPTDKDALKAAIAEAEALAEADYTAETWAKLAEELEAAKAVNADEDALQSAIDKAVAALKAAIEALEKAPEQGGSKSEWYVGDVNLDGKINSLDYLLLKRKVIGTFVLPEDRKPVADINGDGKINSTDYMLLKRAVLEMFVLPKEPVVIEVANPDVTTDD